MVKPGMDAGTTTAAPAWPSRLARMRARRAGFVVKVDGVAGPAGLEALAGEGRDAHRITDELHEIAQKNTPAEARTAKRARTRHALVLIVVCCVLGVSMLWVADSAIGYTTKTPVPGRVQSRSTVIVDNHAARADCFTTNALQPVFRGGAPFTMYRCGEGMKSVLVSGPISVGVLAAIVLCLTFLAISQTRWRRKNAWY
jgi:hypothetical protein